MMHRFWTVTWAVLAMCCTSCAAAAAPVAVARRIPYWTGPGPIRACTSEWTPMVYCDHRAAADYGGYEIELFRRVAAQLGWQDDMLEWQCLPWDDLMRHFDTADGVCDMVVAGMEVNQQAAVRGVDFTWPTYKNGLAVMVKAQPIPEYNKWGFFGAFTWELWLITFATACILPFIVFAIDWFAYRWPSGQWPQGTTEDDTSLSRYFWESITRPMWMRGQIALSWAGNLVILIYAFLMLILFSLYVSYATSSMAANLIDGDIQGIESLPGKAVGTWADYADKLRKKGVEAVTYPWDTKEDENYMIQQLKSGSVKAIVLDASLMAFIAAGDCDLTVVGSPFQVSEQATAFRAGAASKELLDAYNTILTNLTNAGVVEELAAAALLPEEPAECDNAEPSSAITFNQVAGLWIITAAASAIAVLMVAAHIIHVRYTSPALVPVLDRSTHNLKQRLGSATALLQGRTSSRISQTGLKAPPSADASGGGGVEGAAHQRKCAEKDPGMTC